MCSNQLKQEIREMFCELEKEVALIIETSKTLDVATNNIVRYVASKITTESEGYVVELYTELVTRLKDEEYFQKPENLNSFYRLNLREKLNTMYQFDIESLESYKKGIEFKEVKALYTSASIAAGVLAVGGVLKYLLTSCINVPIVAIIAGAVIAGIGSFMMYSQRNKNEYRNAVIKYLNDLENEILDWLCDIEVYFESQVRTLYR